MRQFFISLGIHGDKTMASYQLPGSVAEHAQQIFMQARQAENERDGKIKTDEFTFHRQMVLARVLSIAKKGSLELSIESYDEAFNLEKQRDEREEARQPPTAKQTPIPNQDETETDAPLAA